MWTWFEAGSLELALADGLVRRAQVPSFEEASQVIDELRRHAHDGRAAALAAAANIEAQARRAAEAVLQQARADAEQIVMQAGEQAQAMYAEAQTQGRVAGDAEGAQRWHERHQRLAVALDNDLAPRRAQIARVVATAVERIVRAEPAGSLFEKALRDVGELLREATAATLRVHPLDRAEAEAALRSLQGMPDPGSRVEIVADESLARGACLFESALGTLDASLEVQLAALAAALADAADPLPREAAAETAQPTLDEPTAADFDRVRPGGELDELPAFDDKLDP
jgi:type III secretion protein L